MKKLTLVTLLISCYSTISYAQVSFDTTYHEKLDADASDFDYRFQVRLTNESTAAEDSNFTWELTKVDMPSEWDYIIRPDDQCGYLWPDTAGTFLLGASEESDQYIYFTFYGQTGTGTIHFAVSSVLNPEYSDTAVFVINAKDLASVYSPRRLAVGVYPNPSNDILTITTEPGSSYRLLNAKGQLVDVGTFYNFINTLDISEQPKGIYYLELTKDDKLSMKKVIVH